MRTLILLALVGFGAQLVDGSLGMAYGVTSSTLLLAVGLTPAAVSATVHLAEVGTTLASGFSHWRFGTIVWRVVGFMAVPGGVATAPWLPGQGTYFLVLAVIAAAWIGGIVWVVRRELGYRRALAVRTEVRVPEKV